MCFLSAFHSQLTYPVQVMKMFMPMLAPAAGTLRWRLPEGSILAPGDLIATLDLTDPGAVTQAVPFTGARCIVHMLPQCHNPACWPLAASLWHCTYE